MLFDIKYEDIPYIKFEGRIIKQYIGCDYEWKNDNKKYYYMLEMDNNLKFYIESCKYNLSLEEAYQVYEKDESIFTSFDTIDELEIDTIQCGTYLDDRLRAGWFYFNQ